MLTDDDMKARMAKGWRGGLPYTSCGDGSTMDSTAVIRGWLPMMIHRHRIFSINDAGAGDRHWSASLFDTMNVRYAGFDLVPRHRDVIRLDITRECMPAADAIVCRHVLNHLDEIRVGMALHLFKQSARFLFLTQFDEYDGAQEFTRLDLRAWLGGYIESSEDGGPPGCRLALWA